jgi:hypothetical protein
MSTKAQDFRVEQQRTAHPPRPKSPSKKRRETPVDAALPGTNVADRHLKLASALTLRTIRQTNAPKTRAIKAAANGKR